MKVKKVRSEVVYQITLNQDELDLLASIVGDQYSSNEVSHIFRVLNDAGADWAAWTKKGDPPKWVKGGSDDDRNW